MDRIREDYLAKGQGIGIDGKKQGVRQRAPPVSLAAVEVDV
jgi:hypothetical protein